MHQTPFPSFLPSLHSTSFTPRGFCIQRHFTIITGSAAQVGGFSVACIKSGSSQSYSTLKYVHFVFSSAIEKKHQLTPKFALEHRCISILNATNGNPASGWRQPQCSTCLHTRRSCRGEEALSLCRDRVRPQKCVFLPIHHHQISSIHDCTMGERAELVGGFGEDSVWHRALKSMSL